MAVKGEASGNRAAPELVEDLLSRLDLHKDEEEEFVWESEVTDHEVKAKWLSTAKVHTNKGFSPCALYADMRSTLNPAREVCWRKIDDNLFTV